MALSPKVVVSMVMGSLSMLVAQEATQPRAVANLACIEDMAVPGYESVPWTTHVSGTAEVVILIGANGAPVSVDVRSKSSYLVTWLKTSLSKAMFSERCSGQKLRLSFLYELRGNPDSSPHTRVTLKSGNSFEIIANPPIPLSTQP